MIQGILAFQFDLNQNEKGDISPEFLPVSLVFNTDQFSKDDYSGLIARNDIFGEFFQHTAGIYEISGAFSNYFIGKLKETPYQVYSYFNQLEEGSQFITICIFELDDELEMFKDIVEEMGKTLNPLYEKLVRAKIAKKIDLIEESTSGITDELKFALFQVDRLSNLDKLQKIGLIYNSKERLEILDILRESPISKKDLKRKMELINRNANIDVLLEPFIELNLVRRDWIKGEIGKGKIDEKLKGEYLFLVKDFAIVRYPHEETINRLRGGESTLFNNYIKKVKKFIKTYDPLKQPLEDSIKLTSLLLKPDMYDFFALMKSNHYPLDKIPKILSYWADSDAIINELKDLEIIDVFKGRKKREWVVLINDIRPLIFWPEFLLVNVRRAFSLKTITLEVAKKAYDLMEVTFPENIVL